MLGHFPNLVGLKFTAQSEEDLNVYQCCCFFVVFLGGVNGRSNYLWQINFSSMEKSKKHSFLFQI